MSPPIWAALGLVLSAGVAGFFSWLTQRQGKALGSRQENRADFNTITERQDKEIERLGERVTASEQAQHEERRVVTVCLRFIEQITRQLRDNGLEPPPVPAELADRMWEA